MKHVLGSFGAAIACVVLALAPASCGGGSGGAGNPSTDFGKMDGTCFYGNCEDVDDPDATVEEDGESPEEGGKPDVPTPPPVENPELVLKITGPTGAGFASTPGAQISLSGVVFGRYASITWMNEKTGESRDASGTAPYWQTESIGVAPFEPNRIRVTAVGQNETVSDTIVVMYNPGFYFPYPVEVKPPSVFVGDTSRVHVTMTLGAFGSMVGDKLRLQQVDTAGNSVKEHGQMTDDGDVNTHGDEVAGDGVYSTQVTLTCSTPGPIYLRVGATAKNFDGTQFDAWSAPVPVDCVARLTESTCMAHQATLKAARQAYEGAIGSGMGAARQAAIDALKADSSVTEVAQVAEDGGIWAAFDDGVLGALNLAAEGTRGGAGEGGEEAADDGDTGAIESGLLAGKIPVLTKDTLLLSPFISEFGSDDEVQLIGGVASQLSCPAFFSVKGPYNNQAAGLSQFRKMSRHGIVAVATHGEAYFKGLSTDAKQRMGWAHMGSHEVLWTGEPVNCTAMTKKTVECQTSAQCPAGTECIITHASFSAGTSQAFGVCHDATQVDLMSGRVVMGDRTYGVAPAFVLKHGIEDRYPQSLIYLGACKSLWNMTLATAFFAAGAKTVAGYSGVVSNPYATKTGGEFIVNMMENKMDVGEAYGIGSQDPDHPGSFFRFFGARHLTISEPGILNQSWETGDLTAWAREGDGRVITKLCTARPAGGKFMSIISTGLGFTTQTGSIEQTFCIPEGTNSFSFFWKFYSEEFNEWCCSQFQDTFKATFTDEKSGKEYKIVDLAVDDLCKPDCFGACSSFGCSLGKHYVGLSASECDFDQGDAWKTDWQKASFDISKTGLAGNVPVRLRFFATDKGDSVYDTAILVDAIKFE